MKVFFSSALLRLGIFLAFVLASYAGIIEDTAKAQSVTPTSRVSILSHYHSTVGTSTAAAIPSASVIAGSLGWSICNDAVQSSSTYMYVGQASDVSTDGVQLAPGACFECPNCLGATLKLMRVLGQASSNGYSVTQARAQ